MRDDRAIVPTVFDNRSCLKEALGNWLLVVGKTTSRREFARLNSTPNEAKALKSTPISAPPRENRAWTGPSGIPWDDPAQTHANLGMGMGGGGVLKIVVIARDREEQNSPLIDTDDTDRKRVSANYPGFPTARSPDLSWLRYHLSVEASCPFDPSKS
jgi:hypothetical protein